MKSSLLLVVGSGNAGIGSDSSSRLDAPAWFPSHVCGASPCVVGTASPHVGGEAPHNDDDSPSHAGGDSSQVDGTSLIASGERLLDGLLLLCFLLDDDLCSVLEGLLASGQLPNESVVNGGAVGTSWKSKDSLGELVATIGIIGAFEELWTACVGSGLHDPNAEMSDTAPGERDWWDNASGGASASTKEASLACDPS